MDLDQEFAALCQTYQHERLAAERMARQPRVAMTSTPDSAGSPLNMELLRQLYEADFWSKCKLPPDWEA